MLTAIVIWVSVLGFGFLFFGILYRVGFFKKHIESQTKDKPTIDIYNLVFSKDEYRSLMIKDLKNVFKYETLADDCGYVPRLFVAGRGSWRATQGNIYTSSMLAKEIQDEFNQRL